MTIEGAASLLLGWASKSLLLEAFGFDSIIELFSATVLLWRLRIEASGRADEAQVESSGTSHLDWLVRHFVFPRCLRCFQFGLRPFHSASHYRHSSSKAPGILIGLVAAIGMPILAGYKLQVAARLNSRALRADAAESITCGYLSIVLMVGAGCDAVTSAGGGSDSVAALALIPFLDRSEVARSDSRRELLRL